MGDSNINSFEVHPQNDLVNLLHNYDFRNCHSLITRPISGSSIDHIYSNIQNSLYIDSIECDISDHNLMSCRIEIENVNRSYVEKPIVHCNYNKVKLYIDSNLPRILQSGNPSDDTSALVSCLQDAISNSSREILERKLLKKEITPWVNGNLLKIIEYKHKLLKKRRRCSNKAELNERLRRISNIIKKAYKDSMNNYYENNLKEIQHDPRKSWKFINETLGRGSKQSINIRDENSQLISCELRKAEIFNNYFIKSVKDLRCQIDQLSSDSINSLRTVVQNTVRFKFSYTTPEEVLNTIQNLKLHKSTGHDKVSSKIIKESKNTLVHYLVNIFNNIIRLGSYPDILKIHKVIPIPKMIHANAVDQFRPITVLPVIDNIFERILYQQISSFMENNNLLNEFQYGFRKGCGTEEAVVNVTNYICKGLDEGHSGVIGVFFDLTKAFDIVDHRILLQKLRFYGFAGKDLNVIESYLSNRKQFAQINSHKSSLRMVEHGVPQGSVLGPLLFSIYLNDIKNLGLTGKLFIYADDICIFYPYKHETVAKAYIERDAALILEFTRINKLLLNANKTQLVRFKPTSQRNNTFSVFVDGKEIVESTSIKFLGTYFQNNLSWSQHIQHVKSKSSQAIGILYKFKNKFGENTKRMIYNALIQSHFNYLAILYGYKKTYELRSLQRVQNKALKVVYNLPLMFSTTALYRDVSKTILPIFGIYKLQLLLYVFKCIHNIGHHTIAFSRIQQTFNTRNNMNLAVSLCRFETTKQRIEYMGSREYNNLPQYLKSITRISLFKTDLKKYLFENLEELLM